METKPGKRVARLGSRVGVVIPFVSQQGGQHEQKACSGKVGFFEAKATLEKQRGEVAHGSPPLPELISMIRFGLWRTRGVRPRPVRV
jgi:hypothetical protein